MNSSRCNLYLFIYLFACLGYALSPCHMLHGGKNVSFPQEGLTDVPYLPSHRMTVKCVRAPECVCMCVHALQQVTKWSEDILFCFGWGNGLCDIVSF